MFIPRAILSVEWVTTFGSELRLARQSLKAERLRTTDSPRGLFVKVQEEFENAFLLESAIGEQRLAEYSFIGFGPGTLLSLKDGRIDARSSDGSKDSLQTDEPLEDLKRLLSIPIPSGLRARSPFRFIGGAVGYISYDSVRYWERLPVKAKDDLSLPDMEFGIYTDGIAFDHIGKTIHYYSLGKENRLDLVQRLLRASPPEREGLEARGVARPTVEKPRFESMVEAAKRQITAGDIFQVVLSKRYDFQLEGDLSVFYEALSEINPSPYMYFLKFGDRKIVGSSPEMLVRVENRQVETFPIAGTRPHLMDKAENAKLTKEMLADPKEKAEHVMLVDLARNDVGRVAKYGTVKVPELLTVQQFSHVQHIVSRVVGALRPEFNSFDAMRAMFPAGTVSGAPKPRAMEIIEEIEPVRRVPTRGRSDTSRSTGTPTLPSRSGHSSPGGRSVASSQEPGSSRTLTRRRNGTRQRPRQPV